MSDSNKIINEQRRGVTGRNASLEHTQSSFSKLEERVLKPLTDKHQRMVSMEDFTSNIYDNLMYRQEKLDYLLATNTYWRIATHWSYHTKLNGLLYYNHQIKLGEEG